MNKRLTTGLTTGVMSSKTLSQRFSSVSLPISSLALPELCCRGIGDPNPPFSQSADLSGPGQRHQAF